MGTQHLFHLLDERSHLGGRNGIQDIPDLNIRRNMMDAEQGLDIASTGTVL